MMPPHKQYRAQQYSGAEGEEFGMENGVEAAEGSNSGESGVGKRKKRGSLVLVPGLF